MTDLNSVKKLHFDDYKKDLSLNYSKLKIWDNLFRNSTLKEFIEYTTSEIKPSRAMLMGTCFGEMFLETDLFRQKTSHWQLSLTKPERTKLEIMKNNFIKIPAVKDLIGNLEIDKEISYFTSYGGEKLKSRFDMVHRINKTIVDLKCSASIPQFAQSFERFRYDLQAGFYSLVFQQVTGYEVEKFVFLVQEYTPKYKTATIEIPKTKLKEFIEMAKKTIKDYSDWKENLLNPKEEKLTLQKIKLEEKK